MSSTLKSVLTARLMSDDSEYNIFEGYGQAAGDQAHLKRWVDGWADNPVWEKIEADARNPGSVYSDLVWNAIQARRIAESVKGGNDPIRRERQKQREELLDLAGKANEMALYFQEAEKYPGVANFWFRFLTLPVTPEQEAVPRVESSILRVQQLRQLHEQEAQLFLRLAGKEPKATTKIRREKRTLLITAFIYLMTDYIHALCFHRHNEAVAILGNIAFPGYDLDAEAVRKTLQPSRRADRAIRALNRPKT
jgi:hypothetical protein